MLKKTYQQVTGSLVIALFSWNTAFAALAEPQKKVDSVDFSAEEILDADTNLRTEITEQLNTNPELLKELGRMGIKKSEVEMRLAAMSDRELQQVQKGAERQVGGDVVVISLTTALLIIIILLLLVR